MYQKNIINKFNQYFHQKMGMYDYTRGWGKFPVCPNCGREDKFGIHLGDNRTNCFVCGYQIKPIDLIMAKEGLETKVELWSYLKAFEGLEYLEPKRIDRKEIPTIALPESFHSLSNTSNQFGKAAYNYLKNKRGLNPEVLAKRGYGYCTEGKLLGYIIIPFYQRNRLIYYIGRTFLDLGVKFYNPEESEIGIGKSHILYNIDSLALYDDIYLVESVMNAETLGEEAIVTLGKFVSNYQLGLILRSEIKSLTIILDPDAYDKSLQLGLKLTPYKKIRIVNLPEGEDVNSLGYEETKKIIDKTNFMNYRQIWNLKEEYGRKHHV